MAIAAFTVAALYQLFSVQSRQLLLQDQQMEMHQNLRFAFSQTVNRPDFRELAPFKYTHIAGGFAVTGNPDLVSADISSYDLRWEWFPSSDEVIAASVFYKDFDNPIENVLVAAADTCMRRPSAALMADVFPDVPLVGDVEGNRTLLSIDKARTLLGYEPRHSWRDQV